MNITRIGLVSLIVGLTLLMHSSSANVAGYGTLNQGELEENQTQNYCILIGPVGPAQLAIGGADRPRFSTMPEGVGSKIAVSNVSVHMKVTDPNNNIIAEQEVVTPYILDVNFDARGVYKVDVTNTGKENSEVPLTVIFDNDNVENRESDKFMLSIALTLLGVVVFVAGLVINFVVRHRKRNSGG